MADQLVVLQGFLASMMGFVHYFLFVSVAVYEVDTPLESEESLGEVAASNSMEYLPLIENID